MLRCPNSGYKEILELGNPFQRFKIVSSIVARAIPITFFGIYVKYIIHKLTISINYNNNHKGPPPPPRIMEFGLDQSVWFSSKEISKLYYFLFCFY